MRILAWHVDSAWMETFVRGAHEYFVPVLRERGPFGRGRPPESDWPASVVEVAPRDLAQLEIDVVVLQRPQELGLAATWLGRKPGIDVHAVYVEHGAPVGGPGGLRHPLADHPELTLVHVAHFNRVFWCSGATPTRVIEPGIADPGYRYDPELASAAVVLDGAATQHGCEADADLLQHFAEVVPLDPFGAGSEAHGGPGALPRAQLHDELARRSVYLHLSRSTSLGRPLLEAMHLGMPVVALATAEVPAAVPAAAGVVSNRLETLVEAVLELLGDPGRARRMGRAARRAARQHYDLERFLCDWDTLLEEIVQ